MRKTKNWLDSYLEWTKELESPEIFNKWVGISTLAATMGRNVWVDRGAYDLFPNLYVILLSNSGECRKSTAMDQGGKLLRPLWEAGDLNIRSKTTVPMFYKNLSDWAERHDGVGEIFIMADELSNLFTKDDYTDALISVLTEGYSGNKPLVKETKTAGCDVIPRPCINLFACTTPKDLRDVFPEKATGMGFTPRCIIIHSEVPRAKNLWVVMDMNIQVALIQDLQEIRTLKGAFTLTPEAKDWVTNWYAQSSVKETDTDGGMNAYFARKQDTVFKLGQVSSVSSRSNLIIEKHDILTALSWLEEVEPFIQEAFQEVGRAKETKYFDNVLRQMKVRGGKATRRELLQANWNSMNKDSLMKVMETLVASGRVLAPEMVVSHNGIQTISWKLAGPEGEEDAIPNQGGKGKGEGEKV